MAKKDYEARREADFRRLGTRTPICGHCGESRPQCLEAHHVAGVAYDSTTVNLCRNCHRVQSDAQRDHPQRTESSDPKLEQAGRFLLGFADLLAPVPERLRQFGDDLIRRARDACSDTEAAP